TFDCRNSGRCAATSSRNVASKGVQSSGNDLTKPRRGTDGMNAIRQPGCRAVWLLLAALGTAGPLLGQAPTGPLPPRPGVPVQQAPKNEIKVQVALVTTPVTVRDSRDDMIHDLEARDFQVTDNGIPQIISHFDLGGDPLSLVFLMETSSRIEPLMPEIRKTGILFTQTVMGQTGEAAVLGFN